VFLCSTFCYVLGLIQFQLLDNIAWYTAKEIKMAIILADYIQLLCLAIFSHLASHNFFHG